MERIMRYSPKHFRNLDTLIDAILMEMSASCPRIFHSLEGQFRAGLLQIAEEFGVTDPKELARRFLEAVDKVEDDVMSSARRE
jgi:hypothetical protein